MDYRKSGWAELGKLADVLVYNWKGVKKYIKMLDITIFCLKIRTKTIHNYKFRDLNICQFGF